MLIKMVTRFTPNGYSVKVSKSKFPIEITQITFISCEVKNNRIDYTIRLFRGIDKTKLLQWNCLFELNETETASKRNKEILCFRPIYDNNFIFSCLT